MNKKNTTKKTVKPAYIVDITECVDEFGVEIAFTIAKQKAGIPLSRSNVEAIMNLTVEGFAYTLAAHGIIKYENDIIEPNTIVLFYKEPKKPNVFKRIWNWLKYTFTW